MTNEQILKNLSINDEILQHGGQIYMVGGSVRDEFLGIESKDLDILVTNIPWNDLEQILTKHGKVDAVGKSFGVLKFKDNKFPDLEIDIAIPRKEKSTGDGHTDFEVLYDHTIPIEDDLFRRDFTCNAIAKRIDGAIIDPFNGITDINKGLIRLVNPDAFIDDPLRMLRAIGFASRFGFHIGDATMRSLKKNAFRIKNISGERILIEFEKIVNKGDCVYAVDVLYDSGILNVLFKEREDLKYTNNDIEEFNKVETMAEFIFLLCKKQFQFPSDFYKKRLKGDTDTEKEIAAIQHGYSRPHAIIYDNIDKHYRWGVHNMVNICGKLIDSKLFNQKLKETISEFRWAIYPSNPNELAVNGHDLMALGFNGKDIGITQTILMDQIYGDVIANDREELIDYIELCKL